MNATSWMQSGASDHDSRLCACAGEVNAHESGLEFEVLDSDPRRVNIVRISGLNAQNDGDEPLVADA